MLLLVAFGAASAHADWLIRGASVVDGSGRAAYTADVALRDGRVAGIGKLEARAGDRIVEAAGLVLAPGFIDAHSHHDRALDTNLDATSAVSQGITTVIVGADGGSQFPLADWMTARERAPAAFNLASFTGHGALRREAMGADYKRAATADEQARMEKLLDADMEAGSLGLSSGLEYDPGIYSTTPELVGLARVAAARGGIYVSHVRSEDVNLDDAWAEVATIAREAKIRAQISHMKISLIDRWGQAPDFLRRLDGWRAEGIDIAGDVYPYTYWNSTFTSIFPKRDFSSLEDARHALEHVAHADGLIIAKYLPEPRFVGMNVAEIAAERGEPAENTLLWLINRAYPDGDFGAPVKPDAVMGVSMREDDVAAFIGWPLASICSDGGLEGGHPRGAGAFPRFLRHYVLDKDPAGLPAAIRRTSALTAERYGLADRGLVTQGRAADLVLFDPATIRDNASIKDSRAVATGIRGVWVNGEQVWDGTKPGGALPGKVLRRSGK